MISLIVNADDLGLHPDIDEGIFQAHREGIVTSATLLATGPSAFHAAQAALAQRLPLGIHLNLASRLRPAAPEQEVRSLLTNEGTFLPSWREVVMQAARGGLRMAEIDLEFRAQIARARHWGVAVDHLDSHQHLHLLPGVRKIVCNIARDFNLPVRWPYLAPQWGWVSRPGPAFKTALIGLLGLSRVPQDVRRVRSLGIFEAGMLNEARLLALIRKLRDGLYEIGCHPGHAPKNVPEEPNWRYGWDAELAALTSLSVREEIAKRGITLRSFSF